MIEQVPIAVLTFAAGAMLEPVIAALRNLSCRKPTLISQSSALPGGASSQLSAGAGSAPNAKPKKIALREHTAAEHAHALLMWLQGPGGLTGEVSVAELNSIHRELCADYGWVERPWISVGRELRRTLGQQRKYGTRGGQKVRVYQIPTVVHGAERVPLRQVA